MIQKTFILFLLFSVFFLFVQVRSAFAVSPPVNTIHGAVFEKTSGRPLPHVTVSVQGTTLATVTDALGHYLLTRVPEGTVTLRASAVGFSTATRSLTVRGGETSDFNFYLEETAVELENVVVSANRNETLRRFAPTLVNVLSAKTFEVTNSCNLSQGLNFQPGVRVETNCQNCGFQQVRINGLDGPYTQILIDSRPVFSALAGIYGLEQIPANLIERVEVMRGGGSALFGASAVAGTINIITREPTESGAKVSHVTTGIGGMRSFAHQTSFNADLLSSDNKLGVSLFGASGVRDGYDANGDGFTELPRLRNQTLGMRTFVKTGIYSKLTAEYHLTHEFRRGGDSLNRPPHEAWIAEQLTHNIHTGGVKYDINSHDGRSHIGLYASIQAVERDSYYGSNRNPDAYGHTRNTTWMGGVQYRYNFDRLLFMPSTVTAGAEYSQDAVTDNMWGYHRYISQRVHTGAVFVQNEWKNQRWSILLGGRLDKHNLLKKPVFSPRANVRYNPSEKLTLRANYAFGFRAPQAFDEDLHIENVGGTVSMIRLAPDLREERSNSLGLSADFYGNIGNWQTNWLVDAFYTDINNVFALRETGEENHILIKERYNEQGALVWGVNIEGRAAYGSHFSLQGGITLQRAFYRTPVAWTQEVEATRRRFRSPETYGYFTALYRPQRSIQLSLSGTYTGSMLAEHRAGYIARNITERTPSFWVLNTKIAYDISVWQSVMQLSAGVQNVFNAYQRDFDLGKNRDSAYIYGPAAPRAFYVGVSFRY